MKSFNYKNKNGRPITIRAKTVQEAVLKIGSNHNGKLLMKNKLGSSEIFLPVKK